MSNMMRYYRMQALDMWAATHSEKVEKAACAVINTTKRVDAERLKYAIKQTLLIVPEISSCYDVGKCLLRRIDFTIEDILTVHNCERSSPEEEWIVDIFKGPLLRVHLFDAGEGSIIWFYMSHIICDGQGMGQYLELVCKFYNDEGLLPENLPKNVRMDIYKLTHRMKAIRCYKIPELENYQSDIGKIKLPFGDNSDARLKEMRIVLEADDMARARRRSKEYGATMNDLFMTAFLRALSCFCEQERYVIHCPMDLRSFFRKELNGRLTICNFTSKYVCPTKIAPGDSFAETLSSVSDVMILQKNRMPAFAFKGSRFLFRWEWLLPNRLMAFLLRSRHNFFSVYYSNCGILNENNIKLSDNEIKSAYLTGGFEEAPSYQFTVSTFKAATSLMCTMKGSPSNLILAEEILGEVKNQLMTWIDTKSA